MTDEGVKEAIAAELARINVSKGCATVTEKKREFQVSAVISTVIRTTTVPEGATAAQVRKAIARLLPPPSTPENTLI